MLLKLGILFNHHSQLIYTSKCDITFEWYHILLLCAWSVFNLVIILYCLTICIYVYKSLVACPSLTDPNNGAITCSLGDDGVPSYEDTCSFTCNDGFELTGNDIWNCQSDGSWTGSEIICIRGKYYLWYICCCSFYKHAVPCPSLTDPENGVMTCFLGDDGVTSYEDICNFTCNTYYTQSGSYHRICQSDESWSGSETICSRSEYIVYLCLHACV